MNQMQLRDASTKRKSVQNEFELMRKLAHAPHSIKVDLRKAVEPALATQAALARFEYPNEGIVSMSLNTHKAVADGVLDNGYASLDAYRRAARQKLKELPENEDTAKRGTLRWYKDKLEEQIDDVRRIANSISQMTQCLDDVLRLAHQMAEKAGEQDYFRKRAAEVVAKFPRL
ncbi:hypothetical protein [Cupriavidus sp. PET2-C1]